MAQVDGKPHSPYEMEQLAAQPRYRPQIVGFYERVRPLTAELARRLPDVCIHYISAESFAGITETVYTDTGHLNEGGNERVVTVMLRRLAECGLVPPAR